MVRNKIECKLCGKLCALSVVARHEESCSKKTEKNRSRPRLCLFQISSLLEDGKYACSACGKPYPKNGISTHYWLNHGEGSDHLERIKQEGQRLHLFNKGSRPWNFGLTANNDERVQKARDKFVVNIREGRVLTSRRGKPLSAQTKEKLSEARSKFLNERGNGGFKSIPWFKSEDSFGNSCTLRGTWELRVSEWLNEKRVLWTRKHYFKYFDGEIYRTYSPDFYIPEDDLVIEVKGYFSEKDKRKMALVREQNPDTVFEIFRESDIEGLAEKAYPKRYR